MELRWLVTNREQKIWAVCRTESRVPQFEGSFEFVCTDGGSVEQEVRAVGCWRKCHYLADTEPGKHHVP